MECPFLCQLPACMATDITFGKVLIIAEFRQQRRRAKKLTLSNTASLPTDR